jgi:hypothetical protein
MGLKGRDLSDRHDVRKGFAIALLAGEGLT